MMTVLWLFVGVFLLFVEFSSAQSQCLTPNRSTASCIPLAQCSPLRNYLYSTSPSDQDYLRQSQCGYYGFTSYVCCPSDSSSTSGTSNFGSSNSGLSRPTYRPTQNNQQYQYNKYNQNQQNHQNQPNQQNPYNPNYNQYPNGQTNNYYNDRDRNQQNQYQNNQQQQQHDNHRRPVGSTSRFTESDLPQPGSCGSQVGDRIVGGNETNLSDYPWMVLVHYRKRGYAGGYFCGGDLIHENYAITAAHCIRGPSLVKSGYTVDAIRLGEHDLKTEIDCQDGDCADPVTDIKVAQTIVHEDYVPESAEQTNDIALLRLERRAPYTDYIRPICLPLARHLRDKNFDDTELLVAGFGKTENASRSDVKLQLLVDGYNLNRCTEVYRYLRVSLNSKHLCAGGEEGRDSCSGDSGGPLTGYDVSDPKQHYSYLAGIVSFGPAQCGIKGFPGVYTRVDKFIDWILSNMRK